MTTSPAESALDLVPGLRPYATALIPHDILLVEHEYRAAIADCCAKAGPWPLVFIGPAGTGKTCAAMCVLDYVVGGRKYFTVSELCEELIAVQNGEREYGQWPDTQSRWWKRWRDLRCTVVDEIGSREKVSDFHYDCVKRAIDMRINLPSIVISNATLPEIERLYDDRIASRLAGGTVVEFGGDDRRLTTAHLSREEGGKR